MIDQFIGRFDRALRTLSGVAEASRPSPAEAVPEAPLTAEQRQHVAGLMRVNHAGEICAQALYEGQAAVAKSVETRALLQQAAAEERDHLAWCRQRLSELEARPSVFDPLWFASSYALGALVGLLGDRVSLGFVAATEDRVEEHLAGHEGQLPEHDQRTRVLLEQMQLDEAKHGRQALDGGGTDFSPAIKEAMAAIAKVMTTLSYRV